MLPDVRLRWVCFPLGVADKTALLADFGVATTMPEGQTHLMDLCGTKVGVACLATVWRAPAFSSRVHCTADVRRVCDFVVKPV